MRGCHLPQSVNVDLSTCCRSRIRARETIAIDVERSGLRVLGTHDAQGLGLEVRGQAAHAGGQLLALALLGHIEHDAAAALLVWLG